MHRFTIILGVLAIFGLSSFYFYTRPGTLPADFLSGLQGNVKRGETVFHAAGCASCHTAPNAEPSTLPILQGAQSFSSPFGVFMAPNISPDPTYGIGDWSALDLANAMKLGTSPDGTHYYPAFPYTSYSRTTPQDVIDLHAFIQTLPADTTPSRPHDIKFPFNIRLSLGIWKLLFADADWITDASTVKQKRGRYLVEALGHCGECHTSRKRLGNLNHNLWLKGASNPSGEGTVPDITPSTLGWSEQDLAFYFETGFTPLYDSAGGHMAHVVQNLSRLTSNDREAIAAYLISLP